tara:strand:+ start:78 stop:332 length:255 start_codon:yes stop_codon:yes gene_type:complete
MAKKKQEVKKITQEELAEIKEIQNNIQRVLLDMGSLDAKKLEIHEKYKEFFNSLENTKKVLEEKYGQVNIDLKDGSYTPIEDKK